MLGLLRGRHFQNLCEIVERCLRLAIRVDDIAQFLQRTENEKSIDEKREKLPYRNALCVNKIKHQKENGCPQEIDEAALNKTEAAEVADLFEFQHEDFVLFRFKAVYRSWINVQTLHYFDTPPHIPTHPHHTRPLR